MYLYRKANKTVFQSEVEPTDAIYKDAIATGAIECFRFSEGEGFFKMIFTDPDFAWTAVETI